MADPTAMDLAPATALIIATAGLVNAVRLLIVSWRASGPIDLEPDGTCSGSIERGPTGADAGAA